MYTHVDIRATVNIRLVHLTINVFFVKSQLPVNSDPGTKILTLIMVLHIS